MKRKKVSGEEKKAGGEREGGEFAAGLGVGGQGVLFEPGQVEADEGDQEDVGIEVAMESKAGEAKQRLGKTGRQDHGANGQETELAPEQRGEPSRLSGGRGAGGLRVRGLGGSGVGWRSEGGREST